MLRRRMRDDQAFRALSPSDKWSWTVVFDFLGDESQQKEPGLCRWELDRIARSIGVSIDSLKRLHESNTLKGANSGEQLEAFIHVNRRGEEQPLIPAQRGPIWFVPELVTSAHLRSRAKETGKDGGNPRLKSADTLNGAGAPLTEGVKGASKDAPNGAHVDPSPPPVSSPRPLSLNPHPAPTPLAAQASAGGAAADGDGNGERKRRRRERSEAAAEEPPAEFRQLTDHWQHRWRSAGVDVKFERFDGVVMASLWNRVGLDLDRAKRVIDAYFADRSLRYEGHPTNLFKLDMTKFISRAAGQNGAVYGNTKPDAAARGEYQSDVRVTVRKLPSQAAGSGGAAVG